MTGKKRSTLRAEVARLKKELRPLEEEIAALRSESLRTIPKGPRYALLLDPVLAARAVGESPPSTEGNGRGFALASMSRWATNVQAFKLLMKIGLPTEAHGVARMGSEVAINACWVASPTANSDRSRRPTAKRRH